MKKLIAIAAILANIGPAAAADLQVKASPSPFIPAAAYLWSGAWIGASLGGGINSTNAHADIGGTPVDIGNTPRGVVGGIGLGYDFQFAQYWVFGLYAEGLLADISNGGNFANLIANNMATNYMLAAGARLGFLITPTTLVYANAGGAGIGDKPNWQVASLSQAISDTRAGYVVGGGIEHKFAPNWSIKLQYDHWDAGTRQVDLSSLLNLAPGAVTASNRIQIDTIRAGLNFRF